MSYILLSDIDGPAMKQECRHKGCNREATTGCELEWSDGGRWWEFYCEEHLALRLEKVSKNQEEWQKEEEEGERKEMGFCPICGYRKTSHALDCTENPGPYDCFAY